MRPDYFLCSIAGVIGNLEDDSDSICGTSDDDSVSVTGRGDSNSDTNDGSTSRLNHPKGIVGTGFFCEGFFYILLACR